MTEKTEALRLADALDELDAQFSFPGMCGEAAAELRRQHAEIEQLREQNTVLDAACAKLENERDELMKAMNTITNRLIDPPLITEQAQQMICPDSPCIAVCDVLYKDTCSGCGRHYLEVARWTEMSESEKDAVWQRIQREGTAWRFNRYKDRVKEQ